MPVTSQVGDVDRHVLIEVRFVDDPGLIALCPTVISKERFVVFGRRDQPLRLFCDLVVFMLFCQVVSSKHGAILVIKKLAVFYQRHVKHNDIGSKRLETLRQVHFVEEITHFLVCWLDILVYLFDRFFFLR